MSRRPLPSKEASASWIADCTEATSKGALPCGKPDVFQHLWAGCEDVGKFAGPLACFDHGGQKLQSSQKPIAGGGVITHHDMARLFTTKIESALAHGIHHITVAHIGAVQINSLVPSQRSRPKIGHNRGHQSAAAELSALSPARGDQPHELIPVGDLAFSSIMAIRSASPSRQIPMSAPCCNTASTAALVRWSPHLC